MKLGENANFSDEVETEIDINDEQKENEKTDENK